jgi:hypothetical protein
MKNFLKESIYELTSLREAVDLAIFSLSLTLCDIYLSQSYLGKTFAVLRFDNVVGSNFH